MTGGNTSGWVRNLRRNWYKSLRRTQKATKLVIDIVGRLFLQNLFHKKSSFVVGLRFVRSIISLPTTSLGAVALFLLFLWRHGEIFQEVAIEASTGRGQWWMVRRLEEAGQKVPLFCPLLQDQWSCHRGIIYSPYWHLHGSAGVYPFEGEILPYFPFL